MKNKKIKLDLKTHIFNKILQKKNASNSAFQVHYKFIWYWVKVTKEIFLTKPGRVLVGGTKGSRTVDCLRWDIKDITLKSGL